LALQLYPVSSQLAVHLSKCCTGWTERSDRIDVKTQGQSIILVGDS